jgi:hypothetical protein
VNKPEGTTWKAGSSVIEQFQAAAGHVLRMQKALNQMNLQIHHVISDITGVTGLRILDAILAGERDAAKLAALRDGRIKATEQTILRSLVGDYRQDIFLPSVNPWQLGGTTRNSLRNVTVRLSSNSDTAAFRVLRIGS